MKATGFLHPMTRKIVKAPLAEPLPRFAEAPGLKTARCKKVRDSIPALPPADPAQPRDRFAAHLSSQISRFATLWWWDQGPITQGRSPCEMLFWERLSTSAGRHLRPWCCYINTIKFYDRSNARVEIKAAECTHYGMGGGLSPSLIGDPRTAIWYEAGCGTVKWSRGHWWMVHPGRLNTRMAHMMNAGWPAYQK